MKVPENIDIAYSTMCGGGLGSFVGFLLKIDWIAFSGSLTAIIGFIFTVYLKIKEQKQKNEEYRIKLDELKKEHERKEQEHRLILEIMRENAKEVINKHFEHIDKVE